MAIKNITTLKSDADSYINDNATRDISPSDIRDRIKDAADSAINRIDDKLLLNLRTYVTTRAYEVGEHCELSLTIYKCTTATSGAFNPAHWVAVIGPESMSLGQLSDVTITSPVLNQVLQYNGSQWVNVAFSGGISSLNGLTGSTQTFATGTSGTDFNISSATTIHTFNLPTASATNRGALSSADWTTFNNKFTLPALTSGSVLFSNGTTIAQDNANLFWDDTNNYLGLGLNTGINARFHIRGTGASSATTLIYGENSASLKIFEVINDGQFVFTSNSNKSIIVEEDAGTDRLGIYIDNTSGHINFSSNNSFYRYWKGGTAGHTTTTNHLLTISPANGRFSITNDSADAEYDSWKFYVNIPGAADRAYFKNTYSGASTSFHYSLYATALGANSGTNVGLYVEAGGASVDNTAIRAYGDIENYNNSAAYYFGAKGTDGTWRIVRSGNNLIFERRETGSYVTKNTITP